MPKPLAYDLRTRVLAAIAAGLSCRAAAERFGVSAAIAIRWQAPTASREDARPKPQGGDQLSHRTEAHAGLIRAVLDEALAAFENVCAQAETILWRGLLCLLPNTRRCRLSPNSAGRRKPPA